MYKVVGYCIKRGEYEGRSYEHLAIYCVVKSSAQGLVGETVTKLKAPSNMNVSDLRIGSEYTFYFDQYGRVMEYKLRTENKGA